MIDPLVLGGFLIAFVAILYLLWKDHTRDINDAANAQFGDNLTTAVNDLIRRASMDYRIDENGEIKGTIPPWTADIGGGWTSTTDDPNAHRRDVDGSVPQHVHDPSYHNPGNPYEAVEPRSQFARYDGWAGE